MKNTEIQVVGQKDNDLTFDRKTLQHMRTEIIENSPTKEQNESEQPFSLAATDEFFNQQN